LAIDILREQISQDASEALPEVAGFQTFDPGRFSAFANSLVMLAITLAVQGGFVGFFLYLRKRAKRIAEVELDAEWSELQRVSRTLAAPRTDATSRNSVRQVNLRGWDPAGPQAR
jgi:hypothetical protein